MIKAGESKTGIDATLVPAIVTAKAPRIAGHAKVGSTLTAKPGNWKPSDVTFSYQWSSNGTTISGATASTYSPTNADVGSAITVTVVGSKDVYTDATATSAPTKPVTGGILTPGAPEVTGTAAKGQTLTVDPGIWTPGTVALIYRWSRNGVSIGGATATTYTLVKADVGKRITVTVKGVEANYLTQWVTSSPTAVVIG
jgi:hypothetical protein